MLKDFSGPPQAGRAAAARQRSGLASQPRYAVAGYRPARTAGYAVMSTTPPTPSGLTLGKLASSCVAMLT
jgi:hypothetical protein